MPQERRTAAAPAVMAAATEEPVRHVRTGVLFLLPFPFVWQAPGHGRRERFESGFYLSVSGVATAAVNINAVIRVIK